MNFIGLTGGKGLNFVIHFVENAQDVPRNGDNLSTEGSGIVASDGHSHDLGFTYSYIVRQQILGDVLGHYTSLHHYEWSF